MARHELKSGDRLNNKHRPRIDRRPFRVEVELAQPAPEGVVVARGGGVNGFALYFEKGDLHFALRRDHKLEIVTARSPSLAMATSLSASLAADGSVRLTAVGREPVVGKAGGLFGQLPPSGLEVGEDLDTCVGDYSAPFAFQGRITSAVLTVETPISFGIPRRMKAGIFGVIPCGFGHRDKATVGSTEQSGLRRAHLPQRATGPLLHK